MHLGIEGVLARKTPLYFNKKSQKSHKEDRVLEESTLFIHLELYFCTKKKVIKKLHNIQLSLCLKNEKEKKHNIQCS